VTGAKSNSKTAERGNEWWASGEYHARAASPFRVLTSQIPAELAASFIESGRHAQPSSIPLPTPTAAPTLVPPKPTVPKPDPPRRRLYPPSTCTRLSAPSTGLLTSSGTATPTPTSVEPPSAMSRPRPSNGDSQRQGMFWKFRASRCSAAVPQGLRSMFTPELSRGHRPARFENVRG
jgi:hypothetical protein